MYVHALVHLDLLIWDGRSALQRCNIQACNLHTGKKSARTIARTKVEGLSLYHDIYSLVYSTSRRADVDACLAQRARSCYLQLLACRCASCQSDLKSLHNHVAVGVVGCGVLQWLLGHALCC